MRRLILLFLLCLLFASVVSAGNDTTMLPAVSFDDMGNAVIEKLSGWFKIVIVIIIIGGGIFMALNKSEKDSATGTSYVKNAILAVAVVLGGLWFADFLYSLPAS